MHKVWFKDTKSTSRCVELGTETLEKTLEYIQVHRKSIERAINIKTKGAWLVEVRKGSSGDTPSKRVA